MSAVKPSILRDKRHYTIEGIRMPRVTTVIDECFPKPWAMAWAAKEERAHCVETASTVLDDYLWDSVEKIVIEVM